LHFKPNYVPGLGETGEEPGLGESDDGKAFSDLAAISLSITIRHNRCLESITSSSRVGKLITKRCLAASAS
jgi:hypothetical protein